MQEVFSLASGSGGGWNEQKAQPEVIEGWKTESQARPSRFRSQQAAVLDSLRSPESKRGYQHAIDEFVQWYCSEPRLSFNRRWSHVTVFTLKTDSSPQELLRDDSRLAV